MYKFHIIPRSSDIKFFFRFMWFQYKITGRSAIVQEKLKEVVPQIF